MKYGDVSYGFEVFEGGEFYANGTAPTLEECIAEAEHYALMVGEAHLKIAYFERREILEP